jgi:hypothetical protein
MSTWTWSRWAPYLGERNFRLPAIFGFTRVPGFWHIPNYRSYSSICCRVFQADETPDRKLSKGITPSNQRRYTNSSIVLYEHQFGDVNPAICGCTQLLLTSKLYPCCKWRLCCFFSLHHVIYGAVNVRYIHIQSYTRYIYLYLYVGNCLHRKKVNIAVFFYYLITNKENMIFDIHTAKGKKCAWQSQTLSTFLILEVSKPNS